MQEQLMTILTFAVSILAIVIGVYGQLLQKRVQQWADEKMVQNGIVLEAKWQADLKAGLLTGAKAALLEGKSIPEAIKAAIAHTLASNAEAAAGLAPSSQVVDNLAKAAVTDALKIIAEGRSAAAEVR